MFSLVRKNIMKKSIYISILIISAFVFGLSGDNVRAAIVVNDFQVTANSGNNHSSSASSGVSRVQADIKTVVNGETIVDESLEKEGTTIEIKLNNTVEAKDGKVESKSTKEIIVDGKAEEIQTKKIIPEKEPALEASAKKEAAKSVSEPSINPPALPETSPASVEIAQNEKLGPVLPDQTGNKAQISSETVQKQPDKGQATDAGAGSMFSTFVYYLAEWWRTLWSWLG